jgi:hypothetical protein
MSADAATGPGPGGDLDAGPIAAWAAALIEAVGAGGTSDVPCGSCTACCTSSQFVLIGPDETDTLTHVPPEVRFPAPGAPAGWQLLPYDEHGRCPLLGPSGCTIYDHRPRTCRTYDCRVFAAAALEPDADKPAIAAQVRRWRFAVTNPVDEDVLRSVRAAARFLEAHADALAVDGLPAAVTQRAVLAVELHGRFVAADAPDVADVAVEVRRRMAPTRDR